MIYSGSITVFRLAHTVNSMPQSEDFKTFRKTSGFIRASMFFSANHADNSSSRYQIYKKTDFFHERGVDIAF